MSNDQQVPRGVSVRRRVVVAAVCAGLFASGCGAIDGAAEGGGSASAVASTSESDGATTTSGAASTSSATSATSVLFDAGTVQDIEITFDQATYDAMIDTYSSTSEKEWIEADVTINGVTFEQAGLRLKGNSSLSSLRGGGGRGGPSGTVSADDPAGLPWLIRLDKYVDGQSYEGVSEIVVRSNGSETALNEALALELLDAAGLATQQSAPARLSVNGSDDELRLIVENPNDEWDAGAFSSEGVLYKAEAGGDYSYRGDDPAAYDDVFDQEAGADEDDLGSLIEFLDFINNSSDEEFAAGIADRLDVDAFARYLAIEDLMNNFDDIDGPGNNSYLRFDAETGRATVVAWDHNLAFGSMAGGMGGGMAGGAGLGPAGGAPAGGGGPVAGDGQGPGFPGGGGPGGGTNILVSRFQDVPELAALYEDALSDLRAELYDSGLAAQILQRRADVLREQATGLVDDATIEGEVADLGAQLTASRGA